MYEFYGFYEDEESKKMMDIINNQCNQEKIKKQILSKQLKKQNKINNIKTVILTIIILIIGIASGIIYMDKVEEQIEQEYNECLKTNDSLYCKSTVRGGIK